LHYEICTNAATKHARRKTGQQLSVALELQADFMLEFGRITTKMNNFLEEGDIDEALSAAHAVGDDAIQPKFKDILFQNPTRNFAT
jgi:predicted metalloprotease